MLIHPELMMASFHARERELIAEADQRRLLARVRRVARAARPPARHRTDATLATCAPRVAASAR
jgi:hypothetical protein